MTMMKARAKKFELRNELILRIETPRRGPGEARVVVENAEPGDRRFVGVLARLLEIWLSARGDQ